MKLKIVEKGWENFTGPLGAVHFENGVSVNNFSHAEALRIGAMVSLVEVDGEGNDLGVVGLSHEFQTITQLGLHAAPNLKTVAEIEAEIAAAANALEAEKAEFYKDVAPTTAPDTPAKVYSREELEAVADEKGIKGLREIGEPLGVKSNSIPGLIDAILEAQA